MTLASSFDEKLKTVQQKVELNIKLIKQFDKDLDAANQIHSKQHQSLLD